MFCSFSRMNFFFLKTDFKWVETDLKLPGSHHRFQGIAVYLKQQVVLGSWSETLVEVVDAWSMCPEEINK